MHDMTLTVFLGALLSLARPQAEKTSCSRNATVTDDQGRPAMGELINMYQHSHDNFSEWLLQLVASTRVLV